MRTTWIHDVWRKSCEDNISATAKQFDCHVLPAFFNLNVTTSGLSKKDKTRVQELVTKHGGKYYGEFTTSLINIVIAKKNASETDKLKAALAAQKDCLQVEWIVDSATRGCALPFDEYRIALQANKKTSTPTKRLNSSQLDVSSASIELSNIQYTNKLNETALSNMSHVSDVSIFGRTRKSHEPVSLAPYKATLDKINIQEVKKAGTFLDGCCVRISFQPKNIFNITGSMNNDKALVSNVMYLNNFCFRISHRSICAASLPKIKIRLSKYWILAVQSDSTPLTRRSAMLL